MKDYLAHIRRDESAEQSIRAHLLRVGDLMATYAAGIGLSSTARLIGILHDLGKCTAEFAEYLDWCRKHPGDYSQAGKVDHSTAGGQLLLQRYGTVGENERLTAQMATLVIFSHHSGLMNYLGEDGKSDFLRRMEKKDVPQPDLTYYYENVIAESKLDFLFQEAVREFSALDAKIVAHTTEGSEAYFFSWGMVHKLLLSMLVDTDRLDSAEFELGEPLVRVWETSVIWKDFADKLEQKIASFSMPHTSKEKKIAALRQEIGDDCLRAAQHPSGVYRLSVPTGGGKTFASMRFALRHARGAWIETRRWQYVPAPRCRTSYGARSSSYPLDYERICTNSNERVGKYFPVAIKSFIVSGIIKKLLIRELL